MKFVILYIVELEAVGFKIFTSREALIQKKLGTTELDEYPS